MSPYKTTFLFLFLVGCFVKTSNASPRDSLVVKTSLGPIRGVRADDGDYNMFMGIPYAKVNRTNPFGSATPQEPFDEIFDANDDSAICPQIEEFNHTTVGSLDCLHINIFAPTTASVTNPKAVMVMIYGGSFNIGFAGRYLYGPKFLIRHDVIFVTLNYRIGPYGFMCLDIPEVPGNEGLKDTLLALRWIKENIAAFGGDPNKITAFGNSAGGSAVDLHVISKHEKVFDQIILQSGTSVAPGYTAPNKLAPLELASHLGFVTDDVHEAILFLGGVEEAAVIDATATLGLSFGLCIEKPFEGVDNFITEDWITASMPKANQMPVLLGITSDEMIAMYDSLLTSLNNDIIRNTVNIGFDSTHPDFRGMNQLVNRFYVGDDDITSAKIFDLIDFYSDFYFNYSMYRVIAKYLANGASEIFFYRFSYVGERNFVRNKDKISVGGPAHADELGYLYDISFYDTPNAEDQLFIDRITALWTNFAKFGNPTPATTDILPVIWEPIRNNSAYYYLDLDKELTLHARPFYRRMSFWELFYAANGHIQITPSTRN